MSRGFRIIFCKTFSETRLLDLENKTGLVIKLTEKPGILVNALKLFEKHKINVTFLNSKPCQIATSFRKEVELFVDFDGKLKDPNVKCLLNDLQSISSSVNKFERNLVPWFPRSLKELNLIGKTVESADKAVFSDSPEFDDEIYRKRRQEIVRISNSYNLEDGLNIPEVKYTLQENEIWSYMWDRLTKLHKQYACEEYKESFANFVKEGIFNRNRIPQLKEVSIFLKMKTNIIFRPVAGFLTQREFLNGLAFKVFHSTQFVRHPKNLLYTPEPDILHELLGHSPLFTNPDFADFSQLIGLASLGASDEDIIRLGNIYIYTLEFGICKQNNENKIYGAGILSSPKELESCMSDKAKYLPFDIFKIANQSFESYDLQKVYFLAPSYSDMKKEILKYIETIRRPFNLTYHVEDQTVEVDRDISFKNEFKFI